MSKNFPIKSGMKKCPSYDEFMRADDISLKTTQEIDKYMMLERMSTRLLNDPELTPDERLQAKINAERFLNKRMQLVEEYDILTIYIKSTYHRLCEELELYRSDFKAFNEQNASAKYRKKPQKTHEPL